MGELLRVPAALTVCVLAACVSRNVQPGDRDWPAANPAPSRFLYLHGTVDASLDVRFLIFWRAGNPDCQFAVTPVAGLIEGAYASYSMSQRLEVTRIGTQIQAKIPVDGMLPGRCRWAFDGVRFGGATGFTKPLIATKSYPLRSGQSPNGVVTLRCFRATEPGNVEGEQGLECRWPKEEDSNSSVAGGVLWWHPESTDLEVHLLTH